jgi:hypothetical protein
VASEVNRLLKAAKKKMVQSRQKTKKPSFIFVALSGWNVRVWYVSPNGLSCWAEVNVPEVAW